MSSVLKPYVAVKLHVVVFLLDVYALYAYTAAHASSRLVHSFGFVTPLLPFWSLGIHCCFFCTCLIADFAVAFIGLRDRLADITAATSGAAAAMYVWNAWVATRDASGGGDALATVVPVVFDRYIHVWAYVLVLVNLALVDVRYPEKLYSLLGPLALFAATLLAWINVCASRNGGMFVYPLLREVFGRRSSTAYDIATFFFGCVLVLTAAALLARIVSWARYDRGARSSKCRRVPPRRRSSAARTTTPTLAAKQREGSGEARASSGVGKPEGD